MNKFIYIIPLFILIFASFSSAATAPFAMNIISNTIYQNTNSTPLAIYAITHSAQLSAYLGSSPSNMLEVAYENGGSITVSSTVYSLAGYNMSSYLLIQPNEYYKFNFTSATFSGQYVPLNIYMISTKTINSPQYSTTAQALFAIGILLSIILLLLVFRVLKFNVGIMGGIEGFAVGMIAAVLIIYALQFTSLIQVSPYTINAFNTTLSVQSQSATTTPLATNILFGTLGYAFIFVDVILSFIYMFLAILVYKNERTKRKYGR